MILFVTGEPGSGKTSLVERLVEKYRPLTTGVLSKEVRDHGGDRIGFDVETIARDRRRVPLARVGLASSVQVGRYGVYVDVVTELIVPAIGRARPEGLLVIDEIARMQMSSLAFRAVVRALVEKGDLPILATVQTRSDPFTNALLARDNVRVFRVTPGNRDQIRHEIDDLLWHNLCAAAK